MSVLSSLRAPRDIFISNHFITLPYPTAIPGIEDQTIIVTGANGGLGYQACQHLLRIGVGKLIMAVRNVDKGEDARQKLLQATGRDTNSVEVWKLDMCSYASVKEFAGRAVASLPRLDAVLANAAICTSEFMVDEGNERSLTVNVITPSLLLLLLLPKLREAPTRGRFSIVSSKVHYLVNLAQLQTSGKGHDSIFDLLSDPKKANMGDRYFLSKLLALYATRGLADAMAQSGKAKVVLNAPNPSYCRSDLERESGGLTLKFKQTVMGARSTEMGSRALVHAVLAGEETHGCFVNDCHVEEPGLTVTSKEGATLQAAFYEELMRKLEAISPGISANI